MKHLILVSTFLISISAFAMPEGDDGASHGTFYAEPHRARPDNNPQGNNQGTQIQNSVSALTTDHGAHIHAAGNQRSNEILNQRMVAQNTLNALNLVQYNNTAYQTMMNKPLSADPSPNDPTQLLNEALERARLARNQENPVPLSAIPDTPEAQLPYRFTSHSGEFHDSLVRQYQDLYKAPQAGYRRENARAFGLGATELADASYTAGLPVDAEFYKEVGKAFLDIAVGLDPVTGFGRSAFELVTGKNLVTGAQLTETERAFAFVGVASMGTSGIASRAFTGLNKFATRMDKIYHGASYLLRARQARHAENFAEAVRKGEEIAVRYQTLLTRGARRNRLTQIHDSNWMNRATNNVFKPNSHVIEGKITGIHGMNFKQVVTEGVEDVSHPFMFRRSQLEGLNPSQLKTKLGLPESARIKVNDVRIPEGTGFLRGETPQGNPGYYIKNFRTEYIMDSPTVFQ